MGEGSPHAARSPAANVTRQCATLAQRCPCSHCPAPHPHPVLCCSYGAFWMSLAIYTTLSAGKVFTAPAIKGDRLMLTLWGIVVRRAGGPGKGGIRAALHVPGPWFI